jgi:hypothetical protein
MAVQSAVAEALAGRRPAARSVEGYGLSRDLARRPRCNPVDQHRLQRHHRPADAQHLSCQAARRRRQRGAARRSPARSAITRPAGDGRLLAASRRDRQGHDALTAYFRTGDIGVDGRARLSSSIVDRKKDMILV